MYRVVAASVESVCSLLLLSKGIPDSIKDALANRLQLLSKLECLLLSVRKLVEPTAP